MSTHSATSHASTIATLDTNKFRIAKSASDLEIESERLSSQLADLQSKLQELDVQGVEGGEDSFPSVRASRSAVDDEVLLMLRVYRDLGIHVDKDEDGEYKKVAITNRATRDVQIVNLDDQFSKFFYANFFWQSM